mmetsp:Transcript_14629/g.14257  ORF Transcript_14629/g.14257 Transcript_14629/m.14257 type:complete len:161 (+) Transcript_14629:166-648(+)
MLVHWVACIWYIIIKLDNTWIPPKDQDAYFEGTLENSFYDMGSLSQYFVVFYYAILTMTGNEVSPQTTLQTVVAAIIIIIGAIVSAFIFGNMAAIMATMNKKSTHFDEQLDLVTATMRQMKLPEDMQSQVLKFMTHIQNSPDLHQDLEKFFAILNEPLKK